MTISENSTTTSSQTLIQTTQKTGSLSEKFVKIADETAFLKFHSTSRTSPPQFLDYTLDAITKDTSTVTPSKLTTQQLQQPTSSPDKTRPEFSAGDAFMQSSLATAPVLQTLLPEVQNKTMPPGEDEYLTLSGSRKKRFLKGRFASEMVKNKPSKNLKFYE